jgi:hypothetical protein
MKRSLITIIAVTMAILIIAAPVTAQGASLNLPSSLIDVIVQNDTTSYFLTTLGNVPSGYDVTNTTYLGWCIDHSVVMTRNETFEAQLYSTSDPPSGYYSTISWNMVNYIINNKLTNFNETQDCIWYFVNNSVTYTHGLDPNETVLVNDAYASGANFVPSPGQTTAVIVIPQNVPPGSGPFQDSIIEVPVPQPLNVTATVTGDATLTGENTYQMNQGATAYFAANAQGGNQPYSYTWYVNDTANTTNQTMAFTAQQTGTYVIYVNATDSSSPPQNATSTNYTINVIPEYPLVTIGLLAGSSAPLITIVRRKKNKA